MMNVICYTKIVRYFLFPSIFERFGLPSLEASAFGVPVLITRCTSLEEVTGGLLNYVDDPMSIDEWIEKLVKDPKPCNMDELVSFMKVYNCNNVSNQYLTLFNYMLKELSMK